MVDVLVAVVPPITIGTVDVSLVTIPVLVLVVTGIGVVLGAAGQMNDLEIDRYAWL